MGIGNFRLIKMLKTQALVLLTLASLATCVNAAPNLVVILMDDLNIDATETLLEGGWLPNIQNHLLNQGVEFKNAFVTNPECCPSRATLLTGQYSHNHLVIANHDVNPLQGGIAWAGWMPEGGNPGREDSTIATWLRDAGYRTGFIGKYLNGYGLHAPAEVADPRLYIPSGWDDWQGLVSPSVYRVYDFDINDNGTLVNHGFDEADYQTDVLAQRAVDFINESSNAGPEPFFLLLASLAPHLEVVNPTLPVVGNDPTGGFSLTIRPAQRHLHLIDDDESNGELPSLPPKPSFNEADLSDKPSCPRDLPVPEPSLTSDPYCVAEHPSFDAEADVPRLEHQYKTILGSMLAVDDMVGRIVDELSATGELDNTVIMFTSDNGWFFGEHRLIGKELAYEESIRVPMIVRAPGGLSNVSSDAVVLNNDIAPTLAALAEITPPYDPDGANLMPLLGLSSATNTWHERKRFLIERWYIPSLLKFDGPTYLALRGLDAVQNFTIIATRGLPSDFNLVTHTEIYDNGIDPYQTDGINVPAAAADQLNNFMVVFRACTGVVCRAFESF